MTSYRECYALLGERLFFSCGVIISIMVLRPVYFLGLLVLQDLETSLSTGIMTSILIEEGWHFSVVFLFLRGCLLHCRYLQQCSIFPSFFFQTALEQSIWESCSNLQQTEVPSLSISSQISCMFWLLATGKTHLAVSPLCRLFLILLFAHC